MTCCIECGKPWGVILDRGDPDSATIYLAERELIETLWEQWECDYEPEELERVDVERLPKFRTTEVVYLTEALARFCEENGICDPCFLDDCWQELAYVDLPAWLLKGRKRRWAVLWDCCNIGHAENYMRSKADA